MEASKNQISGGNTGIMHRIARIADALPHPFIMFLVIFLVTLGLSAVMSQWVAPVRHPAGHGLQPADPCGRC